MSNFQRPCKKRRDWIDGISKKAEKDPSIDFKFDELLKEQAAKDCVVTTWLGPWIIKNADIKIKLHASKETRAKRVFGRDGMKNIKEAISHIEQRDEQNRSRYKKIYNIDIFENDIFDAVLNSEIYSPKELLQITKKIIEIKKMKNSENRSNKNERR